MTIAAYKATGALAGSTNAITVNWPTHVSNDYALMVLQSGGSEPVTLASAEGFAEVSGSPLSDGSGFGTSSLTVFGNRATGSSMGNPTTNDSGDHQMGYIITFSDVITSGDPFDVITVDTLTSPSTSGSTPALTTTVSDILIAAICTTARDNNNSVEFSGWTNADLVDVVERVDRDFNAGNGGGFGMATGEKATAGSVGVTTLTLATSSRQCRMTLAIKSPTSSGGGTSILRQMMAHN